MHVKIHPYPYIGNTKYAYVKKKYKQNGNSTINDLWLW